MCRSNCADRRTTCRRSERSCGSRWSAPRMSSTSRMLKLDGGARPGHEGVPDRLCRIERIRHAAARMDDLLQVELDLPPGRQLQQVVELEHDLPVAHRKEAAGER